MDIKVEKTLLESTVHVLLMKAQTETISIEREYVYGLIDRLKEAVHTAEALELIADEEALNYQP